MQATYLFVFLSVLANLFLIKITSLKTEQFGLFFSFLSILCSSLPSSIANETSKFIVHISFKLISLFFLFNVLVVMLFENFNFKALFLLANLLRGFVSAILINTVMSILMLSSNNGRNIKGVISFLSMIIAALIFYVFCPLHLISFLSILINSTGFLYFFFLEEKISPINFDFSALVAHKKIVFKSFLIRFAISLVLSLNKKMLILLALCVWFFIKYVLLVCIIAYLVFTRLSKFSQGTVLFLITTLVKIMSNKNYDNMIYKLCMKLMVDITLDHHINLKNYKEIILKKSFESFYLIEKTKQNNLILIISSVI